MRHVTTVSLLLFGVVLAAATQSHAQTSPPTTQTPPTYSQTNGYCFLTPYNTLTPCPTSPTPTPAIPAPIKLLAVSSGTQAAAGTTSYVVNVTSRVACFPLNEPISLYALGSEGAAALTQFYPTYVPSKGSPVNVVVDQRIDSPRAGEATLNLEVLNAAVGPEGLDLKAVWPQEDIERIVPVIAAAPATAAPTLAPAQATAAAAATATPSATGTSGTPTPGTTGTPGTPSTTATGTPVATPVSGPLFVNACVQPLRVAGKSLGGGSATLYAQTVAGAVCSPSITFSDASAPGRGSQLRAQTAGSNGIVAFPFTEQSSGAYGIASVTCSIDAETQTGYTYFFIRQKLPPGPEPGGVCPAPTGQGTQASANVDVLNPTRGSDVTVTGCLAVSGTRISGAAMTATYHFANFSSACTGTTGANGVASCTQNIDNAQPRYPVVVEVSFAYKGKTYVAVTEFTPA